MPINDPIAKPAIIASQNRLGKVAGAAKQMALESFARWREHKAGFMFTGASVLVACGSMLAAMVTIRWISPEDLGLWNSVRLALVYAMFALAGMNSGLSRELPYFFGKSDETAARKLAGTTLSYLLGAGLLVLLGGAASLVLFQHYGAKLEAAIAAVTLLILFNYYTNYLVVTFRSSNSFRDFSKIKFGEAFITVGTIPLIYYLGYGGLLTRTLVLGGVVLGLMHWLRPVRVSPQWDGKSFLLLLKTGIPFFALEYIGTSAATCDRLVLLHFGGVKLVGYYALALMAWEAINIVPNTFGQYIYPRMSHSYGQHHDPIRLWKMAVKSGMLVVAFMIPAVIAGWFLMPPVVTKLFPKYAAAVAEAQWMLVGAIFYGAGLGRMAIWSMKDLKFMTCYQVLYSVFVIIGPILGGVFGKNTLVDVSLGMMFAQAAWLPVGGYLIYRATHRRRANPPAPSAAQ